MPNHITILTPIITTPTDDSDIERCRQYLRANAEPGSGMQCKPDFPFDFIPALHFASFVILEATDDFEPTLVFEATFDGSKADFVSDPACGRQGHARALPALQVLARLRSHNTRARREYLINHDRELTSTSGNTGRTVAEISDEGGIRSKIVSYFSGRQPGGFAPRLGGLFVQLRGFIAEQTGSRWAEQQAPVEWEVRFRRTSAVAAAIAVLALACLIGAACDWVAVAYGHAPPSEWMVRTGKGIVTYLASRIQRNCGQWSLPPDWL
jgi:hypothetical protein